MDNDMSNCFASRRLPSRRTGRLLNYLDRTSIWTIMLFGLIFYCSIAILFSIIELILTCSGIPCIQYSNGIVVYDLFDIVYFNFISMLTIGYGDLTPVFIARLFSIIESVFGVGAFTILFALVMTKLLLPPKNTVVFSKYAYFCTDYNRFMIIFVNTSTTNLVNVQISSYFKLGGDWGVKPSITAPFITQSIQTFLIDAIHYHEIKQRLCDGDCLRVGIAGDLRFTRFSTSIEYGANEIIVINNRDILTKYKGFHCPNFKNTPSEEMFNYRAAKSKSLDQYILEN